MSLRLAISMGGGEEAGGGILARRVDFSHTRKGYRSASGTVQRESCTVCSFAKIRSAANDDELVTSRYISIGSNELLPSASFLRPSDTHYATHSKSPVFLPAASMHHPATRESFFPPSPFAAPLAPSLAHLRLTGRESLDGETGGRTEGISVSSPTGAGRIFGRDDAPRDLQSRETDAFT